MSSCGDSDVAGEPAPGPVSRARAGGQRLQPELVGVLQSLVRAAVAGLRRLTGDKLDIDQHNRFSSMMETLCSEALGKILSILDSIEVQPTLDELPNLQSDNPHVLYILQDSRVGVEHSYGVIHKRNTEQTIDKSLFSQKDGQSEKEDAANPQLIPVSIKDTCGNSGLEAEVDGTEKCHRSSHSRRDTNSPEDEASHRSSDTSTEENDQSETEEESGIPESVSVFTINNENVNMDIFVNEIECSMKASFQMEKDTAQKNLTDTEIEESAQNEALSEEVERGAEPASFPVSVKIENDDSALEAVAVEMHDSVTFSLSSCTSVVEAAPSVPQKWRFNCGICEIGFDSESTFRKHMCSHTGGKPFKCPSCDSSYHQAASLKRHMYKHSGERPFKCPECGKGFTDKDKLRGHMSVHTGQKAFACTTCGKSFTAKTNLYRHIRLHSDQKPYMCSECGRSYTRPETLRDHMALHIPGDTRLSHSFKCSFCERVFSQKANLVTHERTHTGERPYVCSLCSKAFRTSVSLKVHLRVHTGEKPYVCDVCGRPFSQQSSLSAHRRVHLNERNYVCPTCKKSFNNPQNLKVHLRVHTGERPFVCGLCGKTFVQDAHLRIHKQHMHSGVKQCVCEHCGKAYADKRNLRLHKCVYK